MSIPQQALPFDTSLSEARDNFFVKAKTSGGGKCPCCDRFGKVYVRRFNAGMALNLIYLYQNTRDGFVHVPSTAPRYILKDNQVGKLTFWNMATAQRHEDDPTKRVSGYWRITDYGTMFVEGKITVWSHVVEYNKKILEFREDRKITIAEALGKPFSYQELMRDAPDMS